MRDVASADPEQKGESLFRRGREKMRAGESKDAISEFDQALELLPDYAEAVAARAESLDAIGRLAEARPEYERARRLWAAEHPGAPDRSYLFRQRGRFTFEIDSYELALERVKTGSFPYVACGNALFAQGRATEALKCYERALRIKPNDPDLVALKGEALSMLGRYKPAIDAFDFALAANARSSEILSARAIAHLGRGEIAAANRDWRSQLQLLPIEQSAARACVALRLADYNVALPELERAIAREPGELYWQLYRLSAMRRLGRPLGTVDVPSGEVWPIPLIALHAGRLSAQEALKRADNDGRRAEAAFQWGVLASETDPQGARNRWQEVTTHNLPALIEYAAARNELARINS